jgi:hypothetical protein
MPLKSAACGRELEAGLRRRPGSNNVTFDGKPLDGVFVMHNRILAKHRVQSNGRRRCALGIDPFLRGDLLKLALDALERAGSLNS